MFLLLQDIPTSHTVHKVEGFVTMLLL